MILARLGRYGFITVGAGALFGSPDDPILVRRRLARWPYFNRQEMPAFAFLSHGAIL
jgi:hypothetical protein